MEYRVCQQNQTVIGKMKNLVEDQKIMLLQKSQEHLTIVQMECENYTKVIAQCKLQECLPKEPGVHQSCSFVGMMQQSFQFAQQIHLPYNSEQVGPIYFLTGYKVGFFGVAMEPLGKFTLYAIPEACATGKGSNIVLSLLHHYFDNFSVGDTESICPADNCCGENKIKYAMQYAHAIELRANFFEILLRNFTETAPWSGCSAAPTSSVH